MSKPVTAKELAKATGVSEAQAQKMLQYVDSDGIKEIRKKGGENMEPKLISLAQAAEILGISVYHLDCIITNKQIRYIPVGKKKYLTEQFLDEFIQLSKTKDIVEIKEEQ